MSATTKHSNDGGDEGDKKRGRRGSKKQEPEVPSTPKSKGRGQKKKDSEAPATPKTTGRGKKKAVEAVNNDVFLPHVPDAPVPDPTFVPTKFKGFTADFLPSHMTPGKSISISLCPNLMARARFACFGVLEAFIYPENALAISRIP